MAQGWHQPGNLWCKTPHTETPVSCPRMPSITDIASTFLANKCQCAICPLFLSRYTTIFAVAKWPGLSPRPTDLNDIGGCKPAVTVSCSRESMKGGFHSSHNHHAHSWCFQPLWKILYNQIGSFPHVSRGENKKYLKPPPRKNVEPTTIPN